MESSQSYLPELYKNYFIEATEEPSSSCSYKVKCKLSPCKNRVINKSMSISKGSTCNLRRHLSVKSLCHIFCNCSEDFAHLVIFLKGRHPNITLPVVNTSGNENNSNDNNTRRRRRENFNDVLVDYLIHDLEPFSKVESPAFKKLILEASKSPVAINVPSRPTVVLSINEKYNAMVENIKNMLSEQTSLCLTADCWSSRKR